MVVGNGVAQSVSAEAGAGAGFGVYIVGSAISIVIAKDPSSTPPSFWGRNKFLARAWWVGVYSVCYTSRMSIIEAKLTSSRVLN